MALIKCPECGNSVSEFAKVCPQCGFSIADALKEYVCPDCGKVITGKMAHCPVCDCPPEFFVEKGKENISLTQSPNNASANISEGASNVGNSQIQTNNVQNDANSDDKSSKISFFVANNEGKLTDEKMRLVQERMATLSDSQISLLLNTSLMSPILVWIVSFFFGYLGIDRFMIGSVGAGVAKLLTFGGFGLWWFIDLFLIGGATRERNFNKIAVFVV